MLDEILKLWPIIATVIPAAITAYFNIKRNADKITALFRLQNDSSDAMQAALLEMKNLFNREISFQDKQHATKVEELTTQYEAKTGYSQEITQQKIDALARQVATFQDEVKKLRDEFHMREEKINKMSETMAVLHSYVKRHTD